MKSLRLGPWIFILLVTYLQAHSETSPGTAITAYHEHLLQLEQVVSSCRASLATSGCDAARVGPDDTVTVAGKPRLVDFEWLRATLRFAAASGKDDKSRARVEAELDAASARLRADGSESGAAAISPDHTQQLARSKSVLDKVLATSEFHNVVQPSLFQKLMDKVFAWLNQKLSGMGNGPFSPLFIRLVVIGSVLVCLTLLVWWYVRQLQRQRSLRLVAPGAANAGSASAVDWQQRLNQAQALAAAGDWRGAVHLVYWAAISRLEAAGNWPADRARTPREYLQLLPAAHRKRADLAILTQSFERIWYGKRTAGEADYQGARSLLERLTAP